MLKRYGLIGDPIEHSHSPFMFSSWFERDGLKGYTYDLFLGSDLGILINVLIEDPFVCGFNVTHPYKESIIPYLSSLDEVVSACKAVNTVLVERTVEGNVFLHGHNTDADGFLAAYGDIIPFDGRTMVLGSGGAARAVRFALESDGHEVDIVSRDADKGHLSYETLNAKVLEEYDLIVQATPLGMRGMEGEMPAFPVDAISPDHLVIDLIYTPEETAFMKACFDKGAMVLNGQLMLREQAHRSYQIWLNPEDAMGIWNGID